MRKYIDLLKILNESITEDETLDEMAIDAVTHVGNWEKNSSFRTQDRKLLNNPKAISKLKTQWKFPEDVNFNVVLLNNKRYTSDRHQGDYSEWGSVGKIADASAWITDTFAAEAPDIISTLRNDAVNVVYISNDAAERVPMTGWIMAHRLGHSIHRGGASHHFREAVSVLDRHISTLVEQYGINYGKESYKKTPSGAIFSPTTRSLIQSICTFKSAREGKLRDSFETIFELFAQFVFTGDLKFNDIPKQVKVSRGYYNYRGGDDYDFDNRTIKDDLAYELRSHFETAIYDAVGQTYIM